MTAHAQQLATARYVAAAVAYLTGELRRLLAVVVVEHNRLLTLAERHGELEALLALLGEVAATCSGGQQGEVERLVRERRGILPALLHPYETNRRPSRWILSELEALAEGL